MNKNISIDLKGLRAKLPFVKKIAGRHAAFTAILLVLLAYVFVVWRISHLATAEPAADVQDATTAAGIPHVDQKAIKQIQALEQSNAAVHSLFENARNNPFQE